MEDMKNGDHWLISDSLTTFAPSPSQSPTTRKATVGASLRERLIDIVATCHPHRTQSGPRPLAVYARMKVKAAAHRQVGMQISNEQVPKQTHIQTADSSGLVRQIYNKDVTAPVQMVPPPGRQSLVLAHYAVRLLPGDLHLGHVPNRALPGPVQLRRGIAFPQLCRVWLRREARLGRDPRVFIAVLAVMAASVRIHCRGCCRRRGCGANNTHDDLRAFAMTI